MRLSVLPIVLSLAGTPALASAAEAAPVRPAAASAGAAAAGAASAGKTPAAAPAAKRPPAVRTAKAAPAAHAPAAKAPAAPAAKAPAPAAKAPAAEAPAGKAPAAEAPAGKAPAAAPDQAAGAGRLELAAVVDRVQKRYDQTVDLRARFTQNTTRAALNRTTVRTGELFLKKPGRLRLNYDTPENEMYLADGKLVWNYRPEDRQAFKQDIARAQLPAALSFLMGKGKLVDEFEITVAADKDVPVGRPGDYKLSLKPKQPQSSYKAMYFVVDPESFLVTHSLLVSAIGDLSVWNFQDIKTNTKLSADLFVWKPPAEVSVKDVGKLDPR